MSTRRWPPAAPLPAPLPAPLTYTTSAPVTSGMTLPSTSVARCHRTRPVTGSIRYNSPGSVVDTAMPSVLAWVLAGAALTDSVSTGPAVAARHRVRPVSGDSAVTGHSARRGTTFWVFVYTSTRPAATWSSG
jgi:hypothetical protein